VPPVEDVSHYSFVKNNTFSAGLIIPKLPLGDIEVTHISNIFIAQLVHLYKSLQKVINLNLKEITSRLLSTESAVYGFGSLVDITQEKDSSEHQFDFVYTVTNFGNKTILGTSMPKNNQV
jgi:hypothetical protein